MQLPHSLVLVARTVTVLWAVAASAVAAARAAGMPPTSPRRRRPRRRTAAGWRVTASPPPPPAFCPDGYPAGLQVAVVAEREGDGTACGVLTVYDILSFLHYTQTVIHHGKDNDRYGTRYNIGLLILSPWSDSSLRSRLSSMAAAYKAFQWFFKHSRAGQHLTNPEAD